MTRKEAKIIVIDCISQVCEWTREELKKWELVFKKLKLKGV